MSDNGSTEEYDDMLKCACGSSADDVFMRCTEDGYITMCNKCYHTYQLKKIAEMSGETTSKKKIIKRK
jgi:hypothetical protein